MSNGASDEYYTIRIPGLNDVFKIPMDPRTARTLRYQRIRQLEQYNSPMPLWASVLPEILNALDDAQDIAFCAMFAGKFLLKKLPARFIPFAGWAITAMEVFNLMNAVMMLVTTPGLTKPDAFRGNHKIRQGLHNPAQALQQFIDNNTMGQKVAFAVQLAQVSNQFFGVGLQLGAVMGAASDAIWGLYRAGTGGQVRIMLPPPADPLGKALRFLSHTYPNTFIQDMLSTEDHELMIIAQKLAIDYVVEAGHQPIQSRVSTLWNEYPPVYTPWHEPTRQALRDAGYDPDYPQTPFIPGYGYQRIFDTNTTVQMSRTNAWERAIKREEGPGTHSDLLYQVYHEGAWDLMHHLTGVDPETYTYNPIEVVRVASLGECWFRIEPQPTPEDTDRLQSIAGASARAVGRSIPVCDDWTAAMTTHNRQQGTNYHPITK